MKRSLFSVLLLFIFLSVVSTASAHTPLGGLTVAVSPDDMTIVTGGNNRVLYVMDAKSLKVKKRIWLKTSIWGLNFNQDGSRLLVEDTKGKIRFVSTETWKVMNKVDKASYLTVSMEANLCAGVKSKGKIIFFSMNDGSLKGKIAIDKYIGAFGLNAKGDKIAVLSRAEKDPAEKEVKLNDIPKDLKGVKRSEFRQKNDGKSSNFYIFEVPSGKELLRKKIFYKTSTGSRMLFDGDAVLILNYSDSNIRIDAQGNIRIFKIPHDGYAIGLSANHGLIGSGSMFKGSYTKVKGLESTEFEIDRLPGWPEYFKGFAFDSEGNAYGTTSAYRITKITPGGIVEKTVPIY